MQITIRVASNHMEPTVLTVDAPEPPDTSDLDSVELMRWVIEHLMPFSGSEDPEHRCGKYELVVIDCPDRPELNDYPLFCECEHT